MAGRLRRMLQEEAKAAYETELADYQAKEAAGTLEEDAEEPELAPEMDREAGSWGEVSDMDYSILGKVGAPVSTIFKPLGFGNAPSTVATVMGLVAKEEVVGVLGVLYGADDRRRTLLTLLEDMSEEEKVEEGAEPRSRQGFNESCNGHGTSGGVTRSCSSTCCARPASRRWARSSAR